MKEDGKSAVSALMDGELAEAPAHRAVDSLLEDPELREQWARHHAIGEAIRGNHVAGADDLASRVRESLASEPVALAPRRARRPSLRARPLAALAASVAVLAVVVLLGLDGLHDDGPGQDTVSSSGDTKLASGGPAFVSAGAGEAIPVAYSPPQALTAESVALTRLTWNDPRPQVEQRLNGYLLNHNEYLATGVRGMLPYARVVGYDPRD